MDTSMLEHSLGPCRLYKQYKATCLCNKLCIEGSDECLDSLETVENLFPLYRRLHSEIEGICRALL